MNVILSCRMASRSATPCRPLLRHRKHDLYGRASISGNCFRSLLSLWDVEATTLMPMTKVVIARRPAKRDTHRTSRLPPCGTVPGFGDDDSEAPHPDNTTLRRIRSDKVQLRNMTISSISQIHMVKLLSCGVVSHPLPTESYDLWYPCRVTVSAAHATGNLTQVVWD